MMCDMMLMIMMMTMMKMTMMTTRSLITLLDHGKGGREDTKGLNSQCCKVCLCITTLHSMLLNDIITEHQNYSFGIVITT